MRRIGIFSTMVAGHAAMAAGAEVPKLLESEEKLIAKILTDLGFLSKMP